MYTIFNIMAKIGIAYELFAY